MSTVAEIEARREARKTQLAAERETQRAIDLEALDALEISHGDSNVAALDLPYTPGLPTLAAVRCPKKAEIQRYRDTVKTRANGKAGDNIRAAQELAAVCLVYPAAEVFAEILEARPGADTQLGVIAVGLAAGSAADSGKD